MKKKDIISYLCSFAILYILYQLIAVHFEQLWFMILYAVIFVLAIGVFFIYGNGFPQKEISRDSLPPEWSEQECEDFLSECKKRRRITHPLLIIALAIGTVFVFDIVFLYFGDTIKKFDIFGGMK